MKSSRFFSFAGCCLTMIIGGPASFSEGLFCQSLWGQVAADAVPPAEKPPTLKKKLPVYESPLLKPKRMLPPGQLFEHRSLAKPALAKPALATPAAKVEPQPLANRAGQPAPANLQPLPGNRQRLQPMGPPFIGPPFVGANGVAPQQSQLPRNDLNRASVYQLGSMGNYVHLSPAMRLHLNRSAAVASPTPSQRLPSAATVPGQGAGNYYPGVSQVPSQKPFANIERPATGLQRYWPLLLEGREDPNSGLIIWRLP